MAPKKKGGGGGGAEEGDGDKLQAILLADSFNNHFRPISLEVAKVLCPLVNAPMIDYTLEFLASGGVQEVFVFCTSHAAAVQKHLDESQWAKHIEIRCIGNANCASAGDALRELDQMGLVHSDPFVLVTGDVVSNLDLQAVVARHKEGRQVDASRIMTLCLKDAGHDSSLRPVLDDLVIAKDNATGQILFYGNDSTTPSIELALEVLEGHAEVEIRSDLLDCRVDVCSPEVLVLISDNFDYQDLRQHFVTNEVVNYEIGNKIVAHMLSPHEYAVSVDDFRLYHSVSRDVIRRWAYPNVPDNGSSGGAATHYSYQRKCIYREGGVSLPRSVKLGDGVVLGAGVCIGEGATLARSVLARGCVVGSGASVTDSYLWQGANVGDGAVVCGAILAAGAVVQAQAVVPRGCVLGRGVVVGEGVALPEFTRATRWRIRADGGDDAIINAEESFQEKTDDREEGCEELGAGGIGRLWDEDAGADDGDWADGDASEASGRAAAVERLRCQSIGCHEEEDWRRHRWSEVRDDDYSLEDADDGELLGSDFDFVNGGGFGIGPLAGTSTPAVGASGAANRARQAPASSSIGEGAVTAGGGGVGGAAVGGRGAEQDYFNEVIKDMVATGAAAGHSPENVLLEVKGHKFAQNRTFAECVRPAVEAVMDRAGCADPAVAGDTSKLVSGMTRELRQWGPMLGKLAAESGGPLVLLESLEAYALAPTPAGVALFSAFRFALQLLYDGELVSDEQLKEWAAQRRAMSAGAGPRRLFDSRATQAFVVWLEEDDDESGSEEDEEEEDD